MTEKNDTASSWPSTAWASVAIAVVGGLSFLWAIFFVMIPHAKVLREQEKVQSQIGVAALNYLDASPSAAMLRGSGVYDCAASEAVRTTGVAPSQARATGKRIAVQCFNDFASSALAAQPDTSPLRPELKKAHDALVNAP